MKKFLTSALFIFSFGTRLNVAFANQYCITECKTQLGIDIRSLAIPTEKTEEYQLCYSTCKTQKKNAGSSSDKALENEKDLADQATNSDKSKDSDKAKDPDKSKVDGKGAEVSGGDSGENTCTENFDTEVSACEQATLKAAKSCDESNSKMDMASNLASQAALLAGQNSSMGIQESCTKMADVAKYANIALTAYRQLCGHAVSACSAACSVSITSRCSGASSARVADEAREAMAGNRTSCQGFSRKMAEATAAVQNFALIQANSKSCAMLADGNAGTKPNICAENPNYPACQNQQKMDCSNPQMANDKVCICSKNPANPICRSNSEPSDDITISSGGDRRMSGSGNLELAGDPEKMAPNANTNPADTRGAAGAPLSGQQGGSVSFGSPNLAPGLEKRLKRKKGIAIPESGGFYSEGSGDSGGKGQKRYEKLSLDDKEKNQSVASSASSKESSSVDLSQFLPGGQFDPNRGRGVAGVGKVGIDGITGPNSDIWMKIRNRYESMKTSLLP